MTYHTGYKLLIDLPGGQKAGTIYRKFTGQNCEMRFYQSNAHSLNFTALSFYLEEVQNKRFFEPIGNPRPFILPFPKSIEDLEEFYHLSLESRLVPDVDEVRLIDPIVGSEDFRQRLYGLIKSMYNEKYELNDV